MPENKTKQTKSSVAAFLNKIKDTQVRNDCLKISDMMQKVSKCEPAMWGTAIVGFGTYHYVYESGREGDMPKIGFSPRKQNITLYLMCAETNIKDELARLGKHKMGKGCLYIHSLNDVNAGVLQKIVAKAFKDFKNRTAHTG